MDSFIIGFDKFLRAGFGIVGGTRPNPAAQIHESSMTEAELRRSAGLMRVNHVGEVCAQALYNAQSQFAYAEATRRQFVQAGKEEEDHLVWTAERLCELGSRPSLLNPLWYAGSFALGVVAARLGDGTSLGFVVETEKQVEAHLAGHLEDLPLNDAKSRAIVQQMHLDEAAHGAEAKAMGASEMPAPVKLAMRAMSKVMTLTAYYI